jgi:tripartite ATP-independent transporter DctM subunit
MSWPEAMLLLLGGAVVLLGSGAPVAFAFLAMNLIGAVVFLGGEPGVIQMCRNMVSSVTVSALTPIPFFVLMGEILFHTGIAIKAIGAIDRLIRRMPGRLAVVTVVAGTVFSAISGSTIATTAILGSLLLPNMLARGYHKNLALGPILAIGSVDMLIPPSAITVLFGSLAGISISQLLIGSVLPGMLMSALIIGYIMVTAMRRPAMAPGTPVEEQLSLVERWRPFFVHVVPLLAIFIVVIGSMLGGFATPTESAAVGAVATIIFGVAHRALTWTNLLASLRATAEVSAMILFIILGATTFAQILGFSGATNGLLALLNGQGFSTTQLIIGMLVILLVLGIFIDQVSMMLLTLPFFMPLLPAGNVDHVWFGILFLIAMQAGLLTPPFGLLLFALKSVAPPTISMSDINRAAFPYVMLTIALLAIVFSVPGFATWLPGLVAR